MHVLRELLIFIIECHTVPHAGGHVFVGEFVENAIAPQDYEVVVFIYLECLDIWFADDYIRISSSEFVFCLGVSKRP